MWLIIHKIFVSKVDRKKEGKMSQLLKIIVRMIQQM